MIRRDLCILVGSFDTIMYKSLFILCLALLPFAVFAQQKITWENLADVEFADKYSQELDEYMLYPTFGESIKKLAGKEVYIRGYIFPFDKEFIILSKNQYSSCFFCGAAGPETVLELEMKPGHPRFKMDQFVTIKGRLKLNRDNVDKLYFILEDAEAYKSWKK